MECNCNNRLIFSFGAAVALSGALVAVIYAATFIPPYVYDQRHQAVQCTVLRGVRNGNYCCDATWRGSMALCNDVIPCYQIVVSYRPPGGSTNVSAYLYYNYQSVAYQNPNYNCSHYVCASTYAETMADGTALLTSKGKPGHVYTCYRNPSNPLEVLVSVTPLVNILLAIIIPSIAMVIGCIVCCLGYKGHFSYCKEEWDEEEVGGDKKDLCEEKEGGDKVEGSKQGVNNGQVVYREEGDPNGTGIARSNKRNRKDKDNRMTSASSNA